MHHRKKRNKGAKEAEDEQKTETEVFDEDGTEEQEKVRESMQAEDAFHTLD